MASNNSAVLSVPYTPVNMNVEKRVYIGGVEFSVTIQHDKSRDLAVYIKPRVHGAFYPLVTQLRCTALNASMNASSTMSFQLAHTYQADDSECGYVLITRDQAVPVVDGKLNLRLRVDKLEYNTLFVLGAAQAALSTSGTSALLRSLAAAQQELERVQAKLAETEAAAASKAAAAAAAVVDLTSVPKRQRTSSDEWLTAVLDRRNPAEMRKELAAMEAAAQRLHAAIDAANTCVVCMEAKREAAFLPCNHMACCEACSRTMTECCICRAPVTSIIVPKIA